MTRAEHLSGTDRIAEVAQTRGWGGRTIVVNVQGDEPQLPALLIDQVASLLEQHADADIATLCTPITSVHEFLDPNVVKVVTGRGSVALYFSRAPIPWHRDGAAQGLASQTSILGAQRHLGHLCVPGRCAAHADVDAAERPRSDGETGAAARVAGRHAARRSASPPCRRPLASTLKLTSRACARRWPRAARSRSTRVDRFFQLGVVRGFQHVAVPTNQQIALVHQLDDGAVGETAGAGARAHDRLP